MASFLESRFKKGSSASNKEDVKGEASYKKNVSATQKEAVVDDKEHGPMFPSTRARKKKNAATSSGMSGATFDPSEMGY